MEISPSNIISDLSPLAKENKQKNKEIRLCQTKKLFYTTKDSINWRKRQPIEMVNYNDHIHKYGWISFNPLIGK